ncbi:18910_t:CDS:2, partial [Dentiscutata erythropus]
IKAPIWSSIEAEFYSFKNHLEKLSIFSNTIAETQYAKKASHYINILNDLRRIGAHSAVDLPTIVFCGNQSAGKSSLLEAISSVQLPRSDGTCTRCVMELRLIELETEWSCQISL